MAEQYASFNSKEPNIDVNLFVNAMTAGINAGNAQKTPLQAVVGGITGGIEKGIQTVQGIQEIELNAAKIDVATDPAVIQAQKDKAIADAQIAQAQAKAKANEDLLLQKEKLKQAELSIAQSEQKLGDMAVKDELGKAIDSGADQATLSALFQKAARSGTFGRDNDFFTQMAAGAEKRLDPVELESYRKIYDAVEQQKVRDQLAKSNELATQAEARAREKEIATATAGLKTIPEINSVISNTPDYVPEKLEVVKLNQVKRDKEGNVIVDANGRPLITDKPANPDDKRYGIFYDGQERGVLTEDAGKKAAGYQSDYLLGTQAIQGNKKLTSTPEAAPRGQVNFENTGLAAEQARIDQRLERVLPEQQPQLRSPSPEALEGKTPEERAAITERFDRQLAKLDNVPREYRDVVRKVNNDPVLRTQRPLVKAMISAESGGDNSAQSPRTVDSQGNAMGGVKGLMQVTGPTFEDMRNKYPGIVGAAKNDTFQGELLVGKVYIYDLFTQFQDLPLTVAAYNAGPLPIKNAMAKTLGSTKTWEGIQEALKKELSPEKYKETTAYVDRVLKFYTFYNG